MGSIVSSTYCFTSLLIIFSYVINDVHSFRTISDDSPVPMSINLNGLTTKVPSLLNVTLPQMILSDAEDLTTFHLYNSSLFVFGKNVLYELSTKSDSNGIVNFKLVNQVDISPSIDEECISSPDACPCSKDNLVRTAFSFQSKKLQVLFACGNRGAGSCWIHKLSNLTQNRQFSNNTPADIFSSARSSVVFPGTLADEATFYVGFERDCNHPFDVDTNENLPSVPFISARSLSKRGFVYSMNSENFVSKLEFHHSKRNYTRVKFIYGFDDTDYAYFVTIQPLNRNSNNFETRIGRICHNNPSFNSYTEIPLSCGDNLLANSVTHFKHSVLGKLLLVSFEPSSKSSATNSSKLCSFTMQQIDKAFVDATSNCLESGSRSTLLSAFYQNDNLPCENIDIDNIQDYLCKRSTNQFILGMVPLNGREILQLEDDRFISIAAAEDPLVSKQFVLISTTEKGSLFRVDVHIDTKHDGKLDISENFVKHFNDLPHVLVNSPVYHKESQSFLLLTKSSVVQVPLKTCSMYTSCTACNHLYKTCRWYKSKCSNFHELPSSARRLICPPEIYSFNPQSGPVEGGTSVTFHGTNFGFSSQHSQPDSLDNFAKITFGSRRCTVYKRNNRLIECTIDDRIQSDLITADVDVKMEVKFGTSNELGYFISGETSVKEKFHFKTPEVNGIFPWFGPLFGGTNVFLYGKHLDIGRNLTVKFGDKICRVKTRSSSYAICNSQRYLTNQISVMSMQINIAIDNYAAVLNNNRMFEVRHIDHQPDEKKCSLINRVQDIFFCDQINRFLFEEESLTLSESFKYMPNPEVFEAGNLNTVAKGGTTMKFVGENLGSSYFPVMALYHEGASAQRIPCTSSRNQTELNCRVPSNDEDELKFFIGKRLHYKLLFDDFNTSIPADVKVFKNPIIQSFNSTELASINDRRVELRGENLRADIPYKIELIAPNNETIQCDARAFIQRDPKYNRLWCIAEMNETKRNELLGTDLKIQVSVGDQLYWSPGVVKFQSDTVSTLTIILVVIVSFILITLILFTILRRRPKHEPIPDIEMDTQIQLETFFLNNSTDKDDFEDLYQDFVSKNMIIESSNIEIVCLIGSGNFGVVYQGIFRPTDDETIDIALKQQKDNTGGLFSDFISEAKVMRNFNHVNVMSLIGLSILEKRPVILLPFMDGKDLKTYILRNTLTVRQLLDFGIQIANGMTYLSELNHVHRDLALRNCMLQIKGTEKPIVKVADFGLTRKFSDAQYYRPNKTTEVPFKWMSPEALEVQRYTTKSDVYSYGVTLWELMTRGKTPYEWLDYNSLIADLKLGNRLPRPEYCPDLIYLIMCSCWMTLPDERPTFRELHEKLTHTVNLLEQGLESPQHSYENSYFAKFVNQLQPFDYCDPGARLRIQQAQEEIIQTKMGAMMYDPSKDIDSTSLISEEPPTYSAATGLPSVDYRTSDYLLSGPSGNRASAPPLSFDKNDF